MTDAEIIKCLQICSTYGGKCTACPAYVKVDRSNCKQVLVGALDIINRQQAEIERLTARNFELSEKGEKVCVALKNAKSEARKEFAERLLQKKYQSSDWSHGEHPFVVEVDDILDVLEEMGCNNA